MKKGKTDFDIEAAFNRVHEQLAFLEKKMDAIISRPAPQSPRPMPQQHHNRFDDRRQERQYYQAVCADCNKECQVPFKPTGDRPVYCKECFAKRKNPGGFRSPAENRPVEKKPFYHAFMEKKPSREGRGSARKKSSVHHKKRSK